MRRTHVIAIVMLVVAATALIISSKDLSTYSTFNIAENSGNRVKVVGTLSLSDPIVYQPEVDPNQFTFFMIDQEGQKRQVTLLQPKPRDFERAEQVVITGRSSESGFNANEILLKCPSKYKDEELALRKP